MKWRHKKMKNAVKFFLPVKLDNTRQVQMSNIGARRHPPSPFVREGGLGRGLGRGNVFFRLWRTAKARFKSCVLRPKPPSRTKGEGGCLQYNQRSGGGRVVWMVSQSVLQ